MAEIIIEVYNPENNTVLYQKTFEGPDNYIEEMKEVFFNLEYNGCLNAHDYNATPLKVRALPCTDEHVNGIL